MRLGLLRIFAGVAAWVCSVIYGQLFLVTVGTVVVILGMCDIANEMMGD